MDDEIATTAALWRAIDELGVRVGSLELRIETTAIPPIPVSFLVLGGMLFVYLVVMGLIVLYLATG